MTQGDAASPRQLGIGCGALEIRFEDYAAKVFRSRVVAGERVVDDLLERANGNRHCRQSAGVPSPVQ